MPTKLLLDFPWTLSDVVEDPDLQFTLSDFVNLLARTGLHAAPFIDEAEQSAFWQNAPRQLERNTSQFLFRFLGHCSRDNIRTLRAAPVPEPPGLALRDSWKRGLRDQLDDLTDWRNPQIIVAKQRHPFWKPHVTEVGIVCESDNGQTDSTGHSRVLAVLEEYESHADALSDRDPWDVRRTAPVGAHSCYLPNPLLRGHDPCDGYVKRVSIEELAEEISAARALGCRLQGLYFYIPPADWSPDHVSKYEWRSGRAFPRVHSPERDRMGFLDYQGHVWVWHEKEGHWDVQFGGYNNYLSVNHLGRIL